VGLVTEVSDAWSPLSTSVPGSSPAGQAHCDMPGLFSPDILLATPPPSGRGFETVSVGSPSWWPRENFDVPNATIGFLSTLRKQ
jgi:hypothetical protein